MEHKLPPQRVTQVDSSVGQTTSACMKVLFSCYARRVVRVSKAGKVYYFLWGTLLPFPTKNLLKPKQQKVMTMLGTIGHFINCTKQFMNS